MLEELNYVCIVTVDVLGAKASRVYNVAIREEHRALEAVKRVFART
jgi:NCAIR mutase (PurE)-related protein